QRDLVDQAIIGGHDASLRRIDETRILSGRKPSVPSARAIGPRSRKASVVADAAGNVPGDRPANPPVALRRDHVLRGDPCARRDIEELLERLRDLDANYRAVHTAL